MKMQMKAQTYKTHDIALSSYLYCSGVKLISIDRQNPHRCVFIFESPKAEVISKWQEGKATANALAFYNAYQFLKAQVFQNE